MASSVSLDALVRRFPGSDRAAVDALTLSVQAGEIVCLVGPSGCGKSTTLRLVAGLDHPDGGSIRIGGRDMAGVAPQKRDVAMVFQGFALYPHMRVRQILAFPLRMRSIRRPERERLVRQTAELLGIGGLLERKPSELSGGEQQRVAMGRALVRNPEVFLFDEPLSNLDAALRAELRVELAKLLRRLEATALYVTHDQSEAMTLGHRIAVLNAGRLEQAATPRLIYEQPASTFVASFFGSPPMNLCPVQRQGSGGLAAGIELGSLPPGAAQLIAGIRPENVLFGEAADAAQLPRGKAIVAAVEPHGSETHIELRAGATTLRARAPGFSAPAPGAETSVALPPAHLRWFDGASGRALGI